MKFMGHLGFHFRALELLLRQYQIMKTAQFTSQVILSSTHLHTHTHTHTHLSLGFLISEMAVINLPLRLLRDIHEKALNQQESGLLIVIITIDFL